MGWNFVGFFWIEEEEVAIFLGEVGSWGLRLVMGAKDFFSILFFANAVMGLEVILVLMCYGLFS